MNTGGHARLKRGHVRATLTPQTRDAGRRSTATAEVLDRPEDEDALVRYVEARLEYRARGYADRLGVDANLRNRPASKQAAARARKELEKAGRAEDVDLVEAALGRHGELLAEDLAHACEPTRPYVRAVAREFVRSFFEKRPETTDELDLLLAKARARAGARGIWRAVLRVGLSAPSLTKSTTAPDGSRVQTKIASGSELLGRMAALDEVALRAALTLDAKIASRRSSRLAIVDVADRVRTMALANGVTASASAPPEEARAGEDSDDGAEPDAPPPSSETVTVVAAKEFEEPAAPATDGRTEDGPALARPSVAW